VGFRSHCFFVCEVSLTDLQMLNGKLDFKAHFIAPSVPVGARERHKVSSGIPRCRAPTRGLRLIFVAPSVPVGDRERHEVNRGIPRCRVPAIHIYTYIYINVTTYVYMYICIHADMYSYVYEYTYILIDVAFINSYGIV